MTKRRICLVAVLLFSLSSPTTVLAQRWTGSDGNTVLNPNSGANLSIGGPVFRYYQNTGAFTIDNKGPNGVVDSTDNKTLLGDDYGFISLLLAPKFSFFAGLTQTLSVYEDGIAWAYPIGFDGRFRISGNAISAAFLPIKKNETVLFRLAPNLTADVFAGGGEFIDIATGVNFAHGYPGASLYSLGDPLESGAFKVLPFSADFNFDSDFDCGDIDALTAEIVSGTNDATFDLTGDGLVNADDRDEWLAMAGSANLPSGAAYLPGDANLDGLVDIEDFNVWDSHSFLNNAAWCSGDFDADGVVDVSDFNIWNENNFTSADVVSVPEPSAVWILLPAIAFLLRRMRLQRR